MATIQHMLKQLNTIMSQEKIGIEVGLSQGAISRLIRGVSQGPTYVQGRNIKALYHKHFQQEELDHAAAMAKIEDLKRSLVIAQGNYEEALTHIEYLDRKINGIVGRRCILCRVKAFFKG